MVIDFFEGNAPKHVESFKIHARNGYYDKTIFHRVIPGFMIQGGDINLINDEDVIDYTIPAELNNSLFHKKGEILSLLDL